MHLLSPELGLSATGTVLERVSSNGLGLFSMEGLVTTPGLNFTERYSLASRKLTKLYPGDLPPKEDCVSSGSIQTMF